MDEPREELPPPGRLGARPALALLALAVVAAVGAAAALLVAHVVRELEVPIGDELPGLAPSWRVRVSALVAGGLLAAAVFGRTRARPGRALVVGLVSAAALGVGWFTALCGAVTVTWFSPQRFEVRVTRHHAVPLLGVQVTPTRTAYVTLPVAAYLEERGLVAPPPRDEARWDFCRGSRFDVRGWIGAARGFPGDLSGADWVAWSRARPGAAAGLWPEVVRAAQAGNYSQARQLLREVSGPR